PLHQLMSACTLQFRIAVLKLGKAIISGRRVSESTFITSRPIVLRRPIVSHSPAPVGTLFARKSYPVCPFESRNFRKTFVRHFSHVMGTRYENFQFSYRCVSIE